MKNHPTKPVRAADAPLIVWSERRAEPDWERYIAALVALSLRRVEEQSRKEERE